MRVANCAAHHVEFKPKPHTLCNVECILHSTRMSKNNHPRICAWKNAAQYGPAAPLMLPSVPTLAHVPALYLPRTACVFAAERFFSACCALAFFSCLPSHVTPC